MDSHEQFVDYFVDPKFVDEFNESMREFLSTLQQYAMAKYVNPEKAQRLKHGAVFTNPAAPQVYNRDIENHSSLFEFKLDSIIAHDLTILNQCFKRFQNDMDEQFAHMIYSSVAEVCDQSGNTVDAKAAGSIQLAFLEMLEKIEFTAEKTGKVNLPEIHLGTDAFNKFTKTMQESTPEYEMQVENIKARKVAEALNREAQRKAKFVRYGESGL